MLELTIVVPAFNEAHRLEAGMLRFEAAVSAGAIDLEQTELVAAPTRPRPRPPSCWLASPTTG